MIGIIGAMPPEIAAIEQRMSGKRLREISGISFISGRLGKNDVVLASCGVGKVFAAVCAEIMILEYSPALIINSGVAGAVSDGIGCGDIVIAASLVQHDMDTSPLGDPRGMISGINIVNLPVCGRLLPELKRAAEEAGIKYKTGVIASGDQFIASQEKRREISGVFGAAACEMEGAAIAQVCYINHTEVIVIRAISDNADGSSPLSYRDFLTAAADASASIICRFSEQTEVV